MRHQVLALLGVLFIAAGAAASPPLVSDTVTITAKPAGATHSNPDIATDGQGTWCAVWCFGDLISNSDREVYVARSADNGSTWTSPAVLNSNAATDEGADDWQALIAFDGVSAWVAVWTQLQALSPSESSIYASRSLDGGISWSSATELSASRSGAKMKLESDHDGTLVLAWENTALPGSSPGRDLLYMRSVDSGATWSEPAFLNTDALTTPLVKFENAPSLVAVGSGRWYACWSTSMNYANEHIAFALSTDNAETWSPPVEFLYVGPEGTDSTPSIAASADGHVAVAWTTGRMWPDTTTEPYADPDIYYTASSDFGATWSCPAPLSERAAIDDTFPEEGNVSLLAAGAGRVAAVWNGWFLGPAQNLYDSEVLFAVSEDHGATWGETLPLNSDYLSETENHAPAFATDAQGVWVTVWGRGGNIPNANSNAVQAATFTFGGAAEGVDEGVVDGEGVADGEGQVVECTFEPTLPDVEEGVVDGEGEGSPTEGINEGTEEGIDEGISEGIAEGIAEGMIEGVIEGIAEGLPEGLPEGESPDGEGMVEGQPEGSPEGVAEGTIEEGELPEGEAPLTPEARETLETFPVIDTNGDSKLDNNELSGHYKGDIAAWLDSLDANDDGALSVAELLRVAAARVIHSADINGDQKLQLAELLRIIQLYNAGGYACAANAGATEDGFEAGVSLGGAPECPAHAADVNADDIIALSELLRGIQLYNLDGYSYCETGSEDNYCGRTSHL